MKLLLCATLSLILCSFEVDSGAIDLGNKLRKRDGDDCKTKITDLDDDCMFLIVERFDYDGLLKVAQMDEKFSALAANVFLCKYSHLQLVIRDSFTMPSNRSELLRVAGMEITDTDNTDRIRERRVNLDNLPPKVTENEIKFFKADDILKTFEHFGHVIKKIKTITVGQNGPLQSELIGKLISKFSSESLVDVEMEGNAELLLKHIEKPLINVKTVSCQGIQRSDDLKDIRATDIFPSVSRLHLHSEDYFSFAFFDCHMPHLEHLTLYEIAYQESVCLNIITKNPQIRDIELIYFNRLVLQNVNTLLPQLESLSYTSETRQDVAIQFETVTTFTLGYNTLPDNLHFPRLQTLIIGYDDMEEMDYGAFLNEHNHLTHLHLAYSSIKDAELQRLTGNLPNLSEITLDQNRNIIALSTAFIVEFLQSHPNVQQLNVVDFHENQQVELQEQLKHEWNIQSSGKDIYFKRKF